MRRILHVLKRLLVFLASGLAAITFFAAAVYSLFRRLQGQIPKPSRFAAPTTSDCQPIPAHRYRRPDPMIYSQRYLQSLGLAITWDNPDIHVELAGVPVDPHDLAPNTTYDVVARVWNNSVEAPAIDLPVQFSYLSFGIGTQAHEIGTTLVDLGVKGTANCPAFAHQTWTTPATPGHYCLLTELIWPDDANPFNNVGQTNTDVKPLNSPHAAFDFEVTNNERVRHVYHFLTDVYAIPVQPNCANRPPGRFPTPTPAELEARARALLDEHNPAAFPVPPGWRVVVDPPEIILASGESRQAKVDVTAPDGFSGRQTFNVHALNEQGTLVGGMTLTVEG